MNGSSIYKMQVKAAECSTELDESECTTGEQLESKSPWKDFWDEELHHYDQEKCNENEVNNHLAESKHFMYEYFHEFKRHLQFLPIWSRVCELGNPNEKTPMTNAHAELYFHLKKSNDEANNIPLTKYLEKNNEFRIAVQRQFVDRFCEDVYKSENSKSFIKSVTNLKSFYEKIPSTPQTFESDFDNIEGKSIEEEIWTQKLSSKSPKLKTSFLKKTNKHLVFDAKRQFKKSRPSVIEKRNQ